MHAPTPSDSNDNQPAAAAAAAASEPSMQEKQLNKLKNEAQLDRETDWDDLQAQVKGTLSFLDSERCDYLYTCPFWETELID